MKTLWIVSGGIEAVPGIQRAKEMGLYVVVSDMNPNAPGFAIADDNVIVSTYDIEKTVEAAIKYHHTVRTINGVICIAADVPLTVASVAHALGLQGISLETAHLATDKLAMKQRFAESNIPIPWFSPVESLKDLKSLVDTHGFPLVLKPVDSRGARGVLKLDYNVNLEWAYQHALKFSSSGRVMVEKYLNGTQVSTESVFIKNCAYTPGFVERNYEYQDLLAPYMIENGGQQPSELSVDQQRSIARLAEEAACVMGITTGIAKGDMVLTKDGPKVIEIAARLSGGWFSTEQIPLATGVGLIEAAIHIAVGENVMSEDLLPKYNKGVAIRYFFPAPGRVVKIKNSDAFKDVYWLHRLNFFVDIGDVVEPVTDHTKRVGFVITTGETRNEAVERALQVINMIEIETAPL
jgi:biotin carboxylase